jgi:cell division ATPase FtsA
MPVRIGEPQGISGLADEANKPDFATAVGLLHYGTKTEAKGISEFSLLKIGKRLEKVPLRGAFGKVADLVKQFLP